MQSFLVISSGFKYRKIGTGSKTFPTLVGMFIQVSFCK
ncbi:hypothetical protein A33Q_0169 [Indibacter alkaliphilus LW1]|uniref:Uncharacterized protein n=1 Tax=Indibacter alkaliphilus (strain CCUG 57479 / KCTC 22604 / LW1) TaxID=1189612 RepID=S2DRT6_INDAL|nr:hypothetical protein A33Q_0169 [Indibacter alkaliphilus LW1]